MVKFGEHLEESTKPQWDQYYLDYKGLKDLIKKAAAEAESMGSNMDFSPRQTSLTVVRAGQKSADDQFYKKLDEEMTKVAKFTNERMASFKKKLKELRSKVSGAKDPAARETLLQDAQAVGREFLDLEKYVNVNYLGFHKILKKHDKNLPHSPCAQFYVTHLHQQPWVQGNYSDMLVQLSAIYSNLRGDASGVKNEESAQGFVRSTTKYWVRMTDVSAVKHHVLQHLPVFQFNEEDQKDWQLVNSAYLDNANMELYHGRLDKRPNAIALRIRWYGEGEPKVAFIERKTHRESWKGEESVKERFTLPEEKVVPFLTCKYTLDQAVADLKKKGKAEAEIAKFSVLFSEIQQQVDSKQLRPMIRTQYQRTAFQIPYDSTVRISLDTNLTMIKENPDDGPACLEVGRWFRDPALPLPRSEKTLFPHAVLEVKLSLPEGQEKPDWVADLLDSGYLTEVHKFSKFIHGTCTLMPDMVQAVPYWVDDESVRVSMQQSAPPQPKAGPARQIATLARNISSAKPRRRIVDSDDQTHPLLGDQPTLQLMPAVGEAGFGQRREAKESKKGFLDWYFNSRASNPRAPTTTMARTTPMRIEPKTFFANERTFLSWLHMAITIGSIAAALLGFSGVVEGSKASKVGEALVEVIALILLPVAIAMCAYSLTVFIWRSGAIAKKQIGYIDDRFGPLGLAVVVVTALTAILIISIIDFVQELHKDHTGPSPGSLREAISDLIGQSRPPAFKLPLSSA